MLTNKTPKNAKNFDCECCNFTCSKQSDFDRHLLTRKHIMLTNVDKKTPKNAAYVCECGKSYKHRQSLHVHKKKCNVMEKLEMQSNINNTDENDSIDAINTIDAIDTIDTTKDSSRELIDYLMKENSELKVLLANSNTTNNTTNFNINMFLNEQCKDAMNLTDFIESIQLSIEDVINIGEQGQTLGFAKILVDKLTSLDLYERPMHCSDIKRETLYVKNNDIWNKETKDKSQIKEAIDHIPLKGIRRVPELNLPNDKITSTVSEIVNTPVNHKKIISTVAKTIKI